MRAYLLRSLQSEGTRPRRHRKELRPFGAMREFGVVCSFPRRHKRFCLCAFDDSPATATEARAEGGGPKCTESARLVRKPRRFGDSVPETFDCLPMTLVRILSECFVVLVSNGTSNA